MDAIIKTCTKDKTDLIIGGKQGRMGPKNFLLEQEKRKNMYGGNMNNIRRDPGL